MFIEQLGFFVAEHLLFLFEGFVNFADVLVFRVEERCDRNGITALEAGYSEGLVNMVLVMNLRGWEPG